MRERDLDLENFSDVKNLHETPMYAGRFVPLDVALFYPGGVLP